MIDKLLDKLVKRYENKARKKVGGIPLIHLIYKPEKEIPNMIFYMHPSIKQDEYLNVRMKEIADHLRENYTDEWN